MHAFHVLVALFENCYKNQFFEAAVDCLILRLREKWQSQNRC